MLHLKKKNITLISANFYPEETAIGFFSSEMINYLQENGNNTSVISSFPYYPQWEIYSSYKNKPKYLQDYFNSIPVYRSKPKVSKNPSFFSRLKLMFTFLWGSYKNSKKINSCDIVIVIVPFTLSIITGIILAKKRKAKLWIHIQDFEFDLAFESGILSKKNIFTLLFKKCVLKFESYLLNKADIISSISNKMLEKAKNKSKVKEYYLFPNWISLKQVSFSNEVHPFISKDVFTLLYSGNIGEKQNWNLFLKVCREIKNINLQINIVIVGDGSFAKKLKVKIKEFDFIKFYDPVPLADLGLLLNSANAHFLFQKTTVIDSVMPSKIMGMMASKKPSIVVGHNDSEVALLFKNNNIGFYFSTENVNDIVDSIIKLKTDSTLSETMGKNAHDFIIQNYSENKILEDLTFKLNSL